MRKFFTLALVTSGIFLACKKSPIAPVNQSNSLATDNLGTNNLSNFDYLITHTWKYNKYYIDVTLAYERGGLNNTILLDNNRTTFNADGTITEIDNDGSSVPGTWKFGDTAQSIVIGKNISGTYRIHTTLLNANNYNWWYHAVDNTNRYGEYVPDDSNIPQKNNFDFVIAHTWEYNKYYIGYVDSAHLGTLVYKRGGAHNSLDLDNDFVTYFANDIISEINNSTLYPGRWKFMDNSQTSIRATNSTGVYKSHILYLNNNHFNWKYHAIDGTERYAEMIPKKLINPGIFQ